MDIEVFVGGIALATSCKKFVLDRDGEQIGTLWPTSFVRLVPPVTCP